MYRRIQYFYMAMQHFDIVNKLSSIFPMVNSTIHCPCNRYQFQLISEVNSIKKFPFQGNSKLKIPELILKAIEKINNYTVDINTLTEAYHILIT